MGAVQVLAGTLVNRAPRAGVIVKAEAGDPATAAPPSASDDGVRALARSHGGLEIGRAEGLLLAFGSAASALAFVRAYRALLAGLRPPRRARMGLHHGVLSLRSNTEADQVGGAGPHEAHGLAVATVARLAALAVPGQVLACEAVRRAADPPAGTGAWQPLGHWRLKGLPEPVSLHEWAEAPTAWHGPPPEDAKAQPVVPDDRGWRALGDVPCNLPVERDGFVGRAEQRADLARRLMTGTPLLTLQGPGGVGKTRLALRVARDLLARCPGGAWFCDLSRADSPQAVRQALARGLGLDAPPPDGGDAFLAEALHARGRCLVVLDNAEQVLGSLQRLLPHWRASAPRAVLLVTSRERLALADEVVVTVEPLSSDEAIELFRRRMAAVRGLPPTDPALDDAALPALVALLDRLPLALELAAARTRLLSPLGLLQRMDDRFRLLTRPGDAGDRHATMQATLAWSWNLLTACEASALAQLSVFDGGFAWTDAATVVRLPDDDTALPDVLRSLQDKSLLQRDADGRYAMLMTVRQFAADQRRVLLSGAGGP
jgi:predicted ATPase/class 3 adenylate cyclase